MPHSGPPSPKSLDPPLQSCIAKMWWSGWAHPVVLLKHTIFPNTSSLQITGKEVREGADGEGTLKKSTFSRHILVDIFNCGWFIHCPPFILLLWIQWPRQFTRWLHGVRPGVLSAPLVLTYPVPWRIYPWKMLAGDAPTSHAQDRL